MPATGLPDPEPDWALFLDLDGTLVELAERPDAVTPAADLPALLTRLAQGLGGAVAVVSGRSLEGVQRLIGATDIPLAGVHGLERRGADGRVHRATIPQPGLDHARERLQRFVAEHPGTLFEDKGIALALHFRTAPRHEAAALAAITAAATGLGRAYRAHTGKFVFELRPTGRDKGTVIDAFLREPPFRGRRPVFIGDDVTDEDGFRRVRELGGYAIRVGPLDGSAAQWTLQSVPEVLEWLDRLSARLHSLANR